MPDGTAKSMLSAIGQFTGLFPKEFLKTFTSDGTPGIYMGWGNSGGNGAWGWIGQLAPAFSKKRS